MIFTLEPLGGPICSFFSAFSAFFAAAASPCSFGRERKLASVKKKTRFQPRRVATRARTQGPHGRHYHAHLYFPPALVVVVVVVFLLLFFFALLFLFLYKRWSSCLLLCVTQKVVVYSRNPPKKFQKKEKCFDLVSRRRDTNFFDSGPKIALKTRAISPLFFDFFPLLGRTTPRRTTKTT